MLILLKYFKNNLVRKRNSEIEEKPALKIVNNDSTSNHDQNPIRVIKTRIKAD